MSQRERIPSKLNFTKECACIVLAHLLLVERSIASIAVGSCGEVEVLCTKIKKLRGTGEAASRERPSITAEQL